MLGAGGRGVLAATGVGLQGIGNGLVSPWLNPVIGAGVVGNGENFGVVGYASPTGVLTDNKWGVFLTTFRVLFHLATLPEDREGLNMEFYRQELNLPW